MIKVKINEIKKEKPNMEGIGWGEVFTDNMIMMDYDGHKWGDVHIMPYGPMSIEPSNTTLHYAQSVFEGQKAYKTKEGINLFRPMCNFRRLNASCERMCIPTLDDEKIEEVFTALKTLLQIEKDWIPEEPNSLYIRMFVFGSENFIGLRTSNKFRFMIILTPIPEYLGGFNPIKLMIPKEIRAIDGGMGEAKTAGNYAQVLKPVIEAHKLGYDQCLFLNVDGIITEASAANIFFIVNNAGYDLLITPMLNGEILDGITRKSLLYLGKKINIPTLSTTITIEDLQSFEESGNLEEIFLCGTAAALIPVKEILYGYKKIKPNQKVGKITTMLYNELLNIQYGRVRDEHNWVEKF